MKNLLLLAISLPLLLGGCGDKPNLKYENLKYEIKDGTVTITGCDIKASGELIIPAIIEGKTVTSIGNEAFRDCKSLTSITIGNGVTSIGGNAFLFCSLTSITIPDSVTSIGDSAFFSCSRLTSITIPDSVTSIGDYAFGSCKSLTSITILDGITSIGDAAFYACTSLTAVTFLGAAPKARDGFSEIRGRRVFSRATPTIYRKPEAKGWGDTFGGRPVKLISEKP